MTKTELEARADQAAASGQLQTAEQLLEQALKIGGDDPALFLKLAGIRRASGQASGALEAVHRALAIAPRDFTALLMRASLIDRLGHSGAGAAWSHALAQRPAGDLPPNLISAVKQGERRQAQYLEAREIRMKSAMADAEARADPEELERIKRFRSNALRRTRPFHSEPTHFHFPGLPEREFHPRRLFPWLDDLEAATQMLAGELQAAMAAERAELVPYVQYDDHLPMDQWRPLNKNPDWTAIHLLQNGMPVEANARHCPATMELMERIPQPRIPGASPNAMFSLLAPGTAIPPHVGVNNARLVCHLPLVVPAGCWFRVGAERRYWRRGEALVFDDTIEHEAMNPSSELRVIFIFDLWHPDLSPIERDAVAALVGADPETGGQPL